MWTLADCVELVYGSFVMGNAEPSTAAAEGHSQSMEPQSKSWDTFQSARVAAPQSN